MWEIFFSRKAPSLRATLILQNNAKYPAPETAPTKMLVSYNQYHQPYPSAPGIAFVTALSPTAPFCCSLRSHLPGAHVPSFQQDSANGRFCIHTSPEVRDSLEIRFGAGLLGRDTVMRCRDELTWLLDMFGFGLIFHLTQDFYS